MPDDLIPLQLKNVGFAYEGEEYIVRNVNLSTPQGKLIAVLGDHGAGKSTFMKLLAYRRFATEGQVLYPEHLRVLHVSKAALLLDCSLGRNLSFGMGGKQHPKQEKAVLEKLRASKKLLETFDKEAAREHEDHDHDLEAQAKSKGFGNQCLKLLGCHEGAVVPEEPGGEWGKYFNSSDIAKVHLARALLVSPQVLVIEGGLTHFNHSEQGQILEVLREHVRNRGLLGDPAEVSTRRPRTVIFSVESKHQAETADVVWMLEGGGEGPATVKVYDPTELAATSRSKW